MNSFTGIFYGLFLTNSYFKEHLWLAASVQSFFYFRKTWSLLSRVGCVLTQEEMPRKDHIQKKSEGQKCCSIKGSRTTISVFPRVSTASTPSSLDQLIEDEIK